MKTTLEYMVGSTAIQIVNTGKRIKVIDVRKEQRKRSVIKILSTGVLFALLTFGSCFYIIGMHNSEELLSRDVYALKSEIEELQNENLLLQKKNDNQQIDYQDIYVKAKKMGMRFPTADQLYEYTNEKSTGVRVNSY